MKLIVRLACLAIVTVLASSSVLAAPRKVIVDQDTFGPAGSNLQAILMLLQSPDVEVLGITVMSGDGWRDESVSHALRMLEVAQRTDIPVYPGAVVPLVNSQAKTRRWEALYGKLYYKGAWTEQWPVQGELTRAPYHADPTFIPPSPAGEPKLKPATEHAANFLARAVREHPGEVTILAMGPLTNIALAASLDPQFAVQARELVLMGGSFNPIAADNHFANEYANAPRREFNFRWDPEAAHIVLRAPWNKVTQIPVDPTTKTFFKKSFFERIARGRAPFAAYLERFGQQYPMWDELAAALWLDPSLATRTTTLLVDVDLSATAGYGNTLSWNPGEGPGLGERAVNVVMDVDVPRFEALTLSLLSNPAPRRPPTK